MSVWLKAAVLAAAAVITITPITANADARIVIGGTAPPLLDTEWTREEWWSDLITLGLNWVPAAATVERVDYPASRGTQDNNIPMVDSILLGASITDLIVRDQLAAGSGPVTVVGMSQGAMVADTLMARWALDPQAPAASEVRFVVMGDPFRGILRAFAAGTTIPLVDVTVIRPVDTPYDVDVVVGEYDGLADPPDRWWNLLADLNAIMGLQFVHGSGLVERADPTQSVLLTRVTNAAGGTTSTYLLPTKILPLTMPLRAMGMSPEFVDQLDAVLRPIVDSAYVRNDTPRPPVGNAVPALPYAASTVAVSAPARVPAGTRRPGGPAGGELLSPSTARKGRVPAVSVPAESDRESTPAADASDPTTVSESLQESITVSESIQRSTTVSEGLQESVTVSKRPNGSADVSSNLRRSAARSTPVDDTEKPGAKRISR
jgi:hypothetical protein